MFRFCRILQNYIYLANWETHMSREETVCGNLLSYRHMYK